MNAPSLLLILLPVSAGLATMGLRASAGAADSRSGGSETDSDGVSFALDVRPILAENCVQCHGPDGAAREAELRLDQANGFDGGWAEDLGGYAAVVPGDPKASMLLERVRAKGKRRMPPREFGEALSEAQIDVLERWIKAGARYQQHWAYAPFHSPELPAVSESALQDGWGLNPVDAFVLARLVKEGRAHAPPAERTSLLRRVSLDLTGLPPTPEETQNFESDQSPDAYGRVVDRLLASEAYAEHWTRNWMDIARYADSHGFTIDGPRSIWPWRDWVLRSIHADEPFDQFSLRQIAGDLLPDATNADVIATGFHRNTQVNQEGGAKDEENRVNAVHDRVATTGTVWLGTTIACAQCHDHKFDPIPARDYFRLFAFFNSSRDGGVSAEPMAFVAGNAQEEAEVAQYERSVAESQGALSAAEEAAAGAWLTWQPDQTKADNGPELIALLDGSFRAIGQNAVFTVYELSGAAPAGGVAALLLEALPLVGLPGDGPGRSNAGNFVVTGIKVDWRSDPQAPWTPVEISEALADSEQDTRAGGGGFYPASDVLDGDDRTGWAIKPGFGRPHLLRLKFESPVPPGAAELRVALEQRFGDNHSLGHFRLRTLPASQDPAQLPGQVFVSEAWIDAFNVSSSALQDQPKLPTSLVLRERRKPRQSHVFLRGSYLDRGAAVEAGFPGALSHLVPERSWKSAADATKALDRLDLARWLTHPDNALAHRVTVNRWWQAFFGIGLVATENDFGLRGASPSHPELLEWLALDFVDSGFSRKALHRRIVTSATYQQAVPAFGTAGVNDPENRLLARQRRLRLPAESIRDAALVASGLLAPRFGGPPVQPPQPDGVFAFTQSKKQWVDDKGADRFRRTLYTRIWRSSVHPFLGTFDAPAPTVTCTRRGRSNSPLQVLALANDPMIQELAAGLGERALREGGDNLEGLRRAFQLALCRVPREREEALLMGHLEDERTRLLEQGLSPELAQRGAWTAVARVLFNLDEFVTRP